MRTSIGYHTFAISLCLTQEDADTLFKHFKKYMYSNHEICIMGPIKYDKDPLGRHYDIVYPNQYKGISWRIRFSNNGFLINDVFMPCSIKAIINPKVLIGEKSYIVAANAEYLDGVEKAFNQEAERVSPILRKFADYTLNRLDYCINFDLSELKFNCPDELIKELPKLIMKLIKSGDIPEHFTDEFNSQSFQFYLKSKSVVINCYWKHDDLVRNFNKCKDLDNSYNIIRFEVQLKYPKVYTEVKSMKKRDKHLKEVMIHELEKQGFYDFSESNDSQKCIEAYNILRNMDNKKMTVIKNMLSDEQCSETIDYYYYETIKSGDYYTFDSAEKIIQAKVCKWEKIVRLTDALKLISECKGISKAKATLQGKNLEDFRRSLRDLARLGINPVTIPKEWGIKWIPNLLDNYYTMLAEERTKQRNDKANMELLKDYLKDCRRKREIF